MRILSCTTHVARKDYPCDGSRCFNEWGLGTNDVDEADWKIWAAAKDDGFQIKAGTEYRRQVYEEGYGIETFRTRLDIDELNVKYELYEEY